MTPSVDIRASVERGSEKGTNPIRDAAPARLDDAIMMTRKGANSIERTERKAIPLELEMSLDIPELTTSLSRTPNEKKKLLLSRVPQSEQNRII